VAEAHVAEVHVAQTYLVDTSVFLRWFIPQVGWEHAREVRAAFLAGSVALETADSARIELGHVLRTKGLQTGRLTRDQYLAAVRAVDDLGVLVHSTDVDALERSAALAADRHLRLIDAIIVDRALERDLPLLTSDARLCRVVDGLLSTELLRGVGGS
jgi:predicted nucleic acid-binding protein